MNFLCICPTYGRPSLALNAAACFSAQDYRGGSSCLAIVDDARQFLGDHLSLRKWLHLKPVHDVQFISVWARDRYPSLPAKYNDVIDYNLHHMRMAWDAVVVWDDDDIYLPWHLSAIAHAFDTQPNCEAVKPSYIWSLYQTDWPFIENASGRFHGSLAFRTRNNLRYPDTGRIDFDQMMLRQCQPLGDTLCERYHSPSYIYRWQSTRAHHCSGDARGPADESWYQRVPITEPGTFAFEPKFDAETVRMMRLLSRQ